MPPFSLTRSVDAILGHLIDRALKSAGAPDDWRDHLGVFAIGGYGRAEFNPKSDLDVIILTHGNSGFRIGRVRLTLNFRPYCGIVVSGRCEHALFVELEEIIQDDFVTATALLEHRPLRADEALGHALAFCLQRFREKKLTALFEF